MRRSLLLHAFVAIVAVALASVGLSGIITRTEALGAFDDYLRGLPGQMGQAAGQGRMMGPGRQMVMGGAERTFLESVDKGIVVGSLTAVALAALVALAIAYYLTRPLKQLTAAARTIADGDLSQRVDAGGPLEVQRLGEAFNEMASSLAESEGLRRRLVADVAHELRNPVASLRAQAEGMAEGVLVADPTRLASLAEDTLHLSRLVDDLQELTAADAGQLSYRWERADLAQVARSEASRTATRAGNRVQVVCECAGELMVTGDDGRLAQVLRNLLDNALRHTDEGSIVIACRREEGMAVIEVRDTGDGIPEADLPYIFERFYRADAARARDTGGSGIGLAISRRIVADHSGVVFAHNDHGGGAVVGFRIPLAS